MVIAGFAVGFCFGFLFGIWAMLRFTDEDGNIIIASRVDIK